jgi:integrase
MKRADETNERRHRSPGEGSFDKRGGRIRFRRMVDGCMVAGHGRTKAEARADFDKKVAELRSGARRPVRSSTTLVEYLNRWLADVAPLTAGPLEVRNKRGTLAHVMSLGARPLQSVTTDDVLDLARTMQREGKGAALVSRVIKTLRQALQHEVDRDGGVIAKNPAAASKMKRKLPSVPPPPRTVVADEDVERLLTEAVARGPWVESYVRLCLEAGLRSFGEVCGLHWGDLRRVRVGGQAAVVLDVQRALVELPGHGPVEQAPKANGDHNYSIRTVPLTPAVAGALERLRASLAAPPTAQTPIFLSETGERPRKSHLARRLWRPLFDAAGLPEGTEARMLRRTFATRALMTGAPAYVVRELMGQSPKGADTLHAHYAGKANLAMTAAVIGRMAEPEPEPGGPLH